MWLGVTCGVMGISMVEGGLCCCLFLCLYWGEGKVCLWLTILTCLLVCEWRERGPGDVVHLSACNMGWGRGGGGGVGVVLVVGDL